MHLVQYAGANILPISDKQQKILFGLIVLLIIGTFAIIMLEHHLNQKAIRDRIKNH